MNRENKKQTLLDLSEAPSFSLLAEKESHAWVKRRLLSLSYLQKGYSVIESAKMCNANPDMIYLWLRRFKQKGLEGLTKHKGRGRTFKFSEHQRQAFRELVLQLKKERPEGRIKGSDILKVIREKLGIKCAISTVYKTLASENLSFIRDRARFVKLSEYQKQVVREEALKLYKERSGGRVKATHLLKIIREKLGVKCTIFTVYKTLASENLSFIFKKSNSQETI